MQTGCAQITELGCGWNWPPNQLHVKQKYFRTTESSLFLSSRRQLPIRSSQYPDWCIIDFFLPVPSWEKSVLLSRMSYAGFLPSARAESYPHHRVTQQLLLWCLSSTPLSIQADCFSATAVDKLPVFGGSRPSFLSESGFRVGITASHTGMRSSRGSDQFPKWLHQWLIFWKYTGAPVAIDPCQALLLLTFKIFF